MRQISWICLRRTSFMQESILPCNDATLCEYAIVQLDLFDSRLDKVVGCKKMTIKKWNNGLKKFNEQLVQTKCHEFTTGKNVE